MHVLLPLINSIPNFLNKSHIFIIASIGINTSVILFVKANGFGFISIITLLLRFLHQMVKTLHRIYEVPEKPIYNKYNVAITTCLERTFSYLFQKAFRRKRQNQILILLHFNYSILFKFCKSNNMGNWGLI
jgi:hypothetical protein